MARVRPEGRPDLGERRAPADARSRDLKIWIDFGSIFQKSPNSGPQGALGGHAYAMTNVDDNGTIPKTSEWTPNHLVKELNNFRQNAQGEVGAEAQPDITSEFKVPYCEYDGAVTTLHAEVCNRGLKTVGAGLNTAFYGGDPEELLCVMLQVSSAWKTHWPPEPPSAWSATLSLRMAR